jgi:hypothetical protein
VLVMEKQLNLMLLKVKKVMKLLMLLDQKEKLSRDLLMLLKEEEVIIANGFMDVVLTLVVGMVANLQEMVVLVVCITIQFLLFSILNYIMILGEKEDAENEVGDQQRRFRQPRQQNWYNSYRGNRRGPPPNRGEGGEYNVSFVVIIHMIVNILIYSYVLNK